LEGSALCRRADVLWIRIASTNRRENFHLLPDTKAMDNEEDDAIAGRS
jgi:hypothetical protein